MDNNIVALYSSWWHVWDPILHVVRSDGDDDYDINVCRCGIMMIWYIHCCSAGSTWQAGFLHSAHMTWNFDSRKDSATCAVGPADFYLVVILADPPWPRRFSQANRWRFYFILFYEMLVLVTQISRIRKIDNNLLYLTVRSTSWCFANTRVKGCKLWPS